MDELLLLYSDDDDFEDEELGHPLEDKKTVLKNLSNGFKYHKNGPAREYAWNKSEISTMAEMILERHNRVVMDKKNRVREIRAQDHLGNSGRNTLLNWVNSCLTGKRFPDNPKILRGPKISFNDWSNHKLWRYVSSTLQAEFHYWDEVNKQNARLPQESSHLARYPKLSDLIFRHNDDFTSGLWSEFHDFWVPFINELR